MKIGGRYKLIGKVKRAVLDLSYEEVLNTFESALLSYSKNSRLSGSVNRETGSYKIEYKIFDNKKSVYENYCMLVEITETDDGSATIEYAFVYDRAISWYTRILSLICFAVPMASSILIYTYFNMRSLIHLAVYIPLLLISAFGVFSFIGYKEKKENVMPMVKEFEKMLIDVFDGE